MSDLKRRPQHLHAARLQPLVVILDSSSTEIVNVNLFLFHLDVKHIEQNLCLCLTGVDRKDILKDDDDVNAKTLFIHYLLVYPELRFIRKNNQEQQKYLIYFKV